MEKLYNMFNPYKGLPKVIYIMFLARVINACGAFIFPIETLILTKKLGMSNSTAGILMTCTGFIYMGASLISGKLADSFGRKKLLITLTSLSALNFLIIGCMNTSVKIIPFLILAGMLSQMSWPVQGAITTDLTTPDTRKATFSLFYMGMNLGIAISPLIAGYLFEHHLRILFIGDALTTLVSTLLVFFFVEESFSKHSNDTPTNDNVLEQKVEGSIIKVLYLRPVLIFFALISFGYQFVYSQWSFLYPIHLEHKFANHGALLYGRYMSLNALIVILFTPLLTSLTSRFKDLRVISFGGILYTIGLGMIGFIDTKPAFLISIIVFTVGEVITTVNFMPFVANHTPASHRGRMNAVLPLISGMGQTLGPVTMGYFITLTSISTGWKFTGFVMLIFSSLMLLLDRYNSRHEISEEEDAELSA